MSTFQRFVVPYDFSEHARAALDTACELARRLGASIQLVHVVQRPVYAYGGFEMAAAVPPPQGDLKAVAEQSLAKVAAGIGDVPGGVTTRVLEGTQIAEAVATCARDAQADLVVMGTHGRTGLAHVFLGSVAERTLRQAPCPVLTVRATEDET